MKRRIFLVFLFSLFSANAIAANKSFRFKIKTKSGGIVGNIAISASDKSAAEYKVKKKYPGCTILSCKEY